MTCIYRATALVLIAIVVLVLTACALVGGLVVIAVQAVSR